MILLYSFEGISSKRNSGDSCEDTPVPMPNTEVKLTNAESTWLEAAWEDRKLLIKKEHSIECSFLLSIYFYIAPLRADYFIVVNYTDDILLFHFVMDI